MNLKIDGNVSQFSPLPSSPFVYFGSIPVNDPLFRSQRVINHLPLVRAIALRVQASMPTVLDLEALFEAGVTGLLSAASSFDPDEEVSFPSYAKHRIRGSILDKLRKGKLASCDIHKQHNQFLPSGVEFAGLAPAAP